MNRYDKPLTIVTFALLLPHIFCCALPVFMSIIGLGASLGVTTMQTAHIEWLHAYEAEILIFGAAMLLVTGVAQYFSWRIDCRAAYCSHGPCAPRKRWSRKVFAVAVVLYIVNILLFTLH